MFMTFFSFYFLIFHRDLQKTTWVVTMTHFEIRDTYLSALDNLNFAVFKKFIYRKF